MIAPLVVAWAVAVAEPGGSGEIRPCGVWALAILGRLEGGAATVDEVDRWLGLPPPDGHSLADLIGAGRGLGIELQGFRLGMDGWPIEGPAIAHLAGGTAGHYVVIRPVGRSGRLVQVIDPVWGDEVHEFADLAASWRWTGAVLLPSGRGHTARHWWLAAPLAVAPLLHLVSRYRQRA